LPEACKPVERCSTLRCVQAPAIVLVPAVRELRWTGRTWLLAGMLGLAADVALGSLGSLPVAEVYGAALVFVVSVGSAIGGLVLGVRTGPLISYKRIFDIAPPPPPEAEPEPSVHTASRAVAIALASTAGMALVAAVVLTMTLGVLGTPRHEILERLAPTAGLVASGWAIVSGLVALRVAAWFARWQRPRGKVILCRPLVSGTMRHVYYVAAAEPVDRGRAG
jgi:hypothetical protein